MVGTIGAAGRSARDRGEVGRWWIRLGLGHLFASMIGGIVVAATAAAAGGLLLIIRRPAWAPVAMSSLLVLLALVDLAGLSARALSRPRQVPLAWKHVFPAPLSSVLYGFTLGL